MSGFGGKADMPIALRNVRYKADICVDRVFVPTRNDIRFWPLADIPAAASDGSALLRKPKLRGVAQRSDLP